MYLQFKGLEIRKKEIFETLIKYVILLSGAAVLAFGLYNVHSQSNITEGGVLGLTLWMEHWFHISPAISGFAVNIFCYLIGLRFMGKDFIKYSIAANCGFTYFYSVYERYGQVLPSYADKPWIAAILGGVLVGVGVGLMIRMGGASSGDDAIALIVNRSFKIPLSAVYFIMDIIVLGLSLTYIPLGKISWSLLTVLISSGVIGILQYTNKQKRISL